MNDEEEVKYIWACRCGKELVEVQHKDGHRTWDCPDGHGSMIVMMNSGTLDIGVDDGTEEA